MHDNAEALIVPIGHYVGAHVPRDDTESEFHVVRIGWEMYELEDAGQFALWALGHGLPEPGDDGTAPWTRSALVGATRASGIPNVGDALADLLARDLLIEVTPGTAEAVEFARVCRTRSLLVGLGNTLEDPLHYAIGASENTPVVRVSSFAYELWKWGHACDSLWQACHIFAAAGEPDDPEESDPERVLTRCLAAIQVLLASGAIYLDEAREDALDDPPVSG
jgi:hypothetical protein